MFKLCTLGLLLGLLIPSQGTVPGTVVRVNREALEYVCQQGKPSLLHGLELMKIQNFVGQGQLLGSVLNVVGINIKNVQLPHLSVKLIPKTGVQLSLSCQLHIRASLCRKYHMCEFTGDHLRNYGYSLITSLELKVGSSIMLDIRVGRTPSGIPFLSITACKSILGDVQIILGGNNLLGFLKPIQDHIRAALVDQMCLSVSNVVLGLNTKMGALVGVNSINPMSRFQYSMLDPPEITSDYIDLDLNAAIALMGRPFDISGPEIPFSLPPPRKDDVDSMVNMGISEPFISKMFATLMKSGVLNFNMRNPSNLKGYHLTTSMLEPAIPSIRQKFPKEVALGLNVVLSKFPLVSFREGAALLRVRISVEVVVDTARSSAVAQTLCTLGVDLTLGLKLKVSRTNIGFSVGLQGGVGLQVDSSSVKIAKIAKMKEIILSKIEKAFLAHLNAVLSVGISLPKMSNLQYVDPQIEIHEGYAQVNCDLDYVP